LPHAGSTIGILVNGENEKKQPGQVFLCITEGLELVYNVIKTVLMDIWCENSQRRWFCSWLSLVWTLAQLLKLNNI